MWSESEGSNPTLHSAWLRDPVSLQGSRWPSGRICKKNRKWLTSGEWGCLLDNGQKLAVGQPNSSLKKTKKTSRWSPIYTIYTSKSETSISWIDMRWDGCRCRTNLILNQNVFFIPPAFFGWSKKNYQGAINVLNNSLKLESEKHLADRIWRKRIEGKLFEWKYWN